jgi:hypothetical protein
LSDEQKVEISVARSYDKKKPNILGSTYALLPEVQLTRDSRDREEEEVGGGVE